MILVISHKPFYRHAGNRDWTELFCYQEFMKQIRFDARLNKEIEISGSSVLKWSLTCARLVIDN